MPILTVDHKLAASRSGELITLATDYHMVKAVTLFNIGTKGNASDNWAVLCLLSGGTDPENIVAVLDQGYLGVANALYWTGSIPLEADTYIGAQVWGTINLSFRLSSVLWKIRIDEKGEFRADP